ncbi:MAG: hypothetical protein QOJ59_2961 [Thermomicrobiales bacterium]|nr:hypothetical protein [Thermomicrobiales bacterium]
METTNGRTLEAGLVGGMSGVSSVLVSLFVGEHRRVQRVGGGPLQRL